MGSWTTAWAARRRLGALLVALALVTGCGGSNPPGSTASPLTLLAARGLQLVRGGIPGPLPSHVPVAGDMAATFAVIDGAASYERQLELRMFRGGDPDDPVEGAVVGSHNEMVQMDHDAFDATARDQGDGRYLLPLPFTMAGEWQLELTITTPQETAAVVLALDVFD